MDKSLLNRVQATLLALATAALFVLAVFNLQQEREFPQPTDGVWWHEVARGSDRRSCAAGFSRPARHIQAGDLLTGVSESPNETSLPSRAVADLERALYAAGPYVQVRYSITRDGIPLDTPVQVIPVPADHSLQLGLRIIGLIYLVIGFYVLFRRWGAPRSTHFYLFCLVSFALYALKYTAEFDFLDWTVFWTNVAAEALQPALFLHFALSFPEERFKNLRRRWLLPLVYAPGAGLLALWLWSIGTREATKLLARPPEPDRHRLRRPVLHPGRAAVPAQLQPRHHAAAAPAVEVGHARNPARGAAFHALLRDSVPAAAQSAATAHQSRRSLAGVFAAHVRLGHRALPADGYGPDLQARRGLHAGYGRCLSAATSASSRSSPFWCTTPCRRRCASGAW